jgi:hypothetical protein
MKSRQRLSHLFVIGMVLGLGGCAAYGEYYEPRPAVRVPPGHMPPPGSCRVWFPDRPPGQQPPPGPCHQLQHQIPPGGTLIHG